MPLVAVALTTGPVRAQDQPADDEKARKAKAGQLFAEGRKETQRGDQLKSKGKRDEANAAYGAAASRFLEAYKNVPNPLLLYVLAQVYQSRGEAEWAKQCYQQYLDKDPKGPKVGDAKKKVAELLAKLEKGEMKTKTAAPWLEPVGVCYEAEKKTPDPKPPEPDTKTDPVENRPDLVTPTTKDSVSRPGGGYRIGFYAAAGVTAGSATVALLTLLQVGTAEDDKNEAIAAYQADGNPPLAVEDACADAASRPEGDRNLAAVVSACDRGKSRAVISNAMQGVAIAGLLASGFLFYKGFLQKGSSGSRERTAEVLPTITPNSVGAQVLLRF